MEGGVYKPGQDVPGTVYRVLRHLATGGMGTVYEVEDTSVEKRYVLKTLHPQLLAREDLARRMKDEAKILARLDHPNIVDVVTAGVTQDAARVPYYVMERLNGQNLRAVLEKKGALDPFYALRIAVDVLEALAHAHAHGVVHRDVKPENIFLHRSAGGVTVTKLLDFGIMRLVDAKASMTQGKFVGTVRYASPEQVVGEPLGPASDLYALALVLYEMLCGRGPFDDVSEPHAIGFAHVHREPPPPSAFARVSPELEALVLAALSKTPARRPRDARAFAEALLPLVPSTSARASSPPPRPADGTAPMVGLPRSTPPSTTAPSAADADVDVPPPRPSRRSVVVPIALASAVATAILATVALYVLAPVSAAPGRPSGGAAPETTMSARGDRARAPDASE